eukprot:gene35632-40306_t
MPGEDDPDNDDQHQKYIKRDESEDGDETPENSTTTSDRLPWSNEVEDDEGSQSEDQDGEAKKEETKNGQCIDMDIESSN